MKTRRLNPQLSILLKSKVLDFKTDYRKPIFDEEERELLGQRLAFEIERIASNIDHLSSQEEYKDFFKFDSASFDKDSSEEGIFVPD